MSEAQLGYQELFLQEEMLYTGWPWTDTLSISLGEEEKCGSISYEILNANETPQTLVKLEIDQFDRS